MTLAVKVALNPNTTNQPFYFQLRVKQILSGHTGPVTAVEACHISGPNGESQNDRTVLVTASADSSVKIWRRNGQGGYIGI